MFRRYRTSETNGAQALVSAAGSDKIVVDDGFPADRPRTVARRRGPGRDDRGPRRARHDRDYRPDVAVRRGSPRRHPGVAHDIDTREGGGVRTHRITGASMSLSRRTLIVWAAAPGGVAALPGGAGAAAGAPRGAAPFPLGVASGARDHAGVVLWTRLAVEPLAA